MASIRRITTKKGTIGWQARWNEPGPNGKNRGRTKNFLSLKEAKEHAARMQDEVERRNVGDPNRHTVEGYLRGWLARLRDRGQHSPATLHGYARHVAMASREIGALPLAKLTAQHLDDLYSRLLKQGGKARRNNKGNTASRPLTARTVLHVHRCVHTAFEQARKWKLIADNPARDATPPSPLKSPVRAFSSDEVKRLLDAAAADEETFAMVAILLSCGLRRSELLGLCWDCIDLDKAELTVARVILEIGHAPVLRETTKTESSRRTLAIPTVVVDLLRAQKARISEQMLAWGKEYVRDPAFVFPGMAGVPMRPQHCTDRLRAVMARAKVKGASPVHAWRHTAGTSLFDATKDIKTVQARLGHSTPAITMALYVHPVNERDRAAADHFGKIIKR